MVFPYFICPRCFKITDILSFFKKLHNTLVHIFPRKEDGISVFGSFALRNPNAVFIPLRRRFSITDHDADAIALILLFQKGYSALHVITSAVKRIDTLGTVLHATAKAKEIVDNLLRNIELLIAFFRCFGNDRFRLFVKILSCTNQRVHHLGNHEPRKFRSCSGIQTAAVDQIKIFIIGAITDIFFGSLAVKSAIGFLWEYRFEIFRFLLIIGFGMKKRHDVFLALLQVFTVS